MNPALSLFPPRQTRIGFHYYPDTLHYRETDLQTWLPELQKMGASWLIVQSSPRRAIPETFITGLIKANIEPLIQFNLSLDQPPQPAELQPIFEAYARQEVHGIMLFDRPNDRSAWQSTDWMRQDLVERFLDCYLPLADLAASTGLIPIFPALEPGGSYWDTAFLRSALEGLDRRKKLDLLGSLVLSAHAWSSGHSLNWGAGGPQRHPEAKPYFTPPNEEDQRGFRIFDWYKTISESILGEACPMILLEAGCPTDPLKTGSSNPPAEKNANVIADIAQLIIGNSLPPKTKELLEPVAEEIIACNFWLLADAPNSPSYSQAWYQEGNNKPFAGVQILSTLNARLKQPQPTIQPPPAAPEPANPAPKPQPEQGPAQTQPVSTTTVSEEIPPQTLPEQPKIKAQTTAKQAAPPRAIAHYLLLPKYEWGVADWHLDVIRPFVKKYAPTIGFSVQEASQSARVTVIGNAQTFSDEIINQLQQAGCDVERIGGDGTSIAIQLAER